MKRFKLSPANGGFYGRFAAKMMSQRDKEWKENTRLREALEFYADEKTYESDTPMYQTDGTFLDMELCIIEDNGYIARQALEGKNK